MPPQYLPIAKRLTKVRAENLSQVDQLISEILEKQKNEITINGQTVDLNDVVTGDVNVGAIACEPQT